ncbi:chromate efflux transporter [Roseibacterium beibuensis]|uniref:chromate efflux transporter n=1 Tax=[Roseibacterium] beibuensis TaxID=1193142 RepID=UPI00217DC396|nr:chromate efflux transporter [Roseibacterium beibuensis]MCS6625351.1 chromate efflux transporter [Roseibacterium beibuensis]
MAETQDIRPPPMTYGALFLRFLRFGFAAFGGPVAQIDMVRRELVEQERWMSGPGFNRLLAVMQALPGPEAHELCVHLGMRARGRIGGLLAGLGFMLPGFVLMVLAAWAYFRFDVDAGVFASALLGAQAAVVALIARAAHRIGIHVLTDRTLVVVGGLAGLATLAGAPFWIVLPAGAAVHVLVLRGRRGHALAVIAATALACLFWSLWSGRAASGPPPSAPAVLGVVSWAGLFLTGLKGGLLTFGGAYTAIPFVRQDLVGRGWVDDGTFLDGVTVANVLPAPLVIFATFSGYAAGGVAGAVAITVGMFLPAFAFSMIFYERLEAVVESRPIRAALDGVAAAVIGVIAATVLSLAAGLAGSPWRTAVLAAIASAALAAGYRSRWRYAAPAILAAAALAGFLLLDAP